MTTVSRKESQRDARIAVVTGATGFLGSCTAKHLLDQGWQVFAVVRPSSPQLEKLKRLGVNRNLRLVFADLDEISKITADVPTADAFLHFGWSGVNRNEINSPEVQRKNVRSAIAALETAISLNCRTFINAGSRQEYGAFEGVVSESDACEPVTAYGHAKLGFYREACKAVATANIRLMQLRIFSIFGAGDHPWSLISTAVRKMPRNEDIQLGECKHSWNFMYIDDFTASVLHCLEYSLAMPGKTDVVNIASRESRVLREYIDEIARVLNSKSQLQYGYFQQAVGSVVSMIPNTHKLNQIVGFQEAYSFAEGIRRMAAHGEPK